jgi:DNA-binding LacI/PurR family transcriptional regulator
VNVEKPISPSAYDVARLAGVSQAAVSRAFTPGASIAKATRERVLQAAQELGYRPNLIARSLSMGRSDIIGVVLGIPEIPTHVAAFEELSGRLTKAGKQIMTFTTQGLDYIADVHVEDLLRYRVDALVLISANMSAKIAEQCRAADIPVITLARLTHAIEGATSVTTTHGKASKEITAHLAAQGYRRLAYMVGYSESVTSREREAVFMAEVAAHGLPAPQRFVGHFTRAGAINAARSLLSQAERPDAIICATDWMALPTIEVARHEFNLKVGPDLGIVGFDDIELASWPSYDLTTYSQPIAHMVDHVMELLQGSPTARPSRIEVEGELKCRGTTRRK